MRRGLVLCIVALSATGCSKGESFPGTFPVTGTVTYQSRPVDAATVTLVPTDAAVRSASGVTDAGGNFAVKTYFGPDHQPAGAMSGQFVVTVSKILVPETPKGLSPQEEQAAFAKAGKPKSQLPKIYESPTTSPLKLTVDGKPSEPQKLELKE